MEKFDLQTVNYEYLANFYNEVQIITIKRKNMRINQNRIAVMCGVCLRTIQKFEDYKVVDDFLLFRYKKALDFIKSREPISKTVKYI